MTIVSIVADFVMGLVFWSYGNIPMSLLAFFISITPVVAVDLYEDWKLRQIIESRPPMLSPIDYAEAQDLAKRGEMKEAFVTLLLKAYPKLKRSDIDKMDKVQIRKLLDKIKAA